jgi:hypothetical protein
LLFGVRFRLGFRVVRGPDKSGPYRFGFGFRFGFRFGFEFRRRWGSDRLLLHAAEQTGKESHTGARALRGEAILPKLSISPAPVRRIVVTDRRRLSMQYMLLIYDAEKTWQSMGEDDRNAMFADYGKYTQELRDAGAFLYGDALQPTATATTVTVRDGETLTTDGPFAETKEQLGGVYVIEAESLDQALEWAAKIPSARIGKIEVRPVMIYDREAAPAS